VIVYSIFDDGGTSYYETLADARVALWHYFGSQSEIERLTLVDLPPRKLAVQLLNGEQFVAKREVVERQRTDRLARSAK
jgi:hypothetical protein